MRVVGILCAWMLFCMLSMGLLVGAAATTKYYTEFIVRGHHDNTEQLQTTVSKWLHDLLTGNVPVTVSA